MQFCGKGRESEKKELLSSEGDIWSIAVHFGYSLLCAGMEMSVQTFLAAWFPQEESDAAHRTMSLSYFSFLT